MVSRFSAAMQERTASAGSTIPKHRVHRYRGNYSQLSCMPPTLMLRLLAPVTLDGRQDCWTGDFTDQHDRILDAVRSSMWRGPMTIRRDSVSLISFALAARYRIVTRLKFSIGLMVVSSFGLPLPPAAAELRVGTAIINVDPPAFPVLVNGGFISKSVSSSKTPVNARALVVDDGEERIAIVVVDSCMMPRELLDDAKRLAAKRTSIETNRMLISATHTHTAPSCMGALGTDADTAYVSFLREKIAESIAAAESNLVAARVGWGVGDAADFTATRRWIRRTDRIETDPFGNKTVRATMHAGANWDDVTGPAGPEDPDLSLLSFQTPEGRPLAVLANFSMHYFGDQPLSADYFGLFCDGLKQELLAGSTTAVKPGEPEFLALMSHGCSGDIWRRDYTLPADQRPNPTIEAFTAGLVEIAAETHNKIQHRPASKIAMAERRLVLDYRVADAQRLEWAEKIVESYAGRAPTDRTEVYAREQIILSKLQNTEIVVQALRIGDFAIATTPNETYALSGLKIKGQSPLPQTMVIELANGGDGYIPPPEQHYLGGYNTWAARSAGLEIEAEPKIVAAAVQLLEQITERPRRRTTAPHNVSDTHPDLANPMREELAGYWQMDDWSGNRIIDASGNSRHGQLEPGFAFYLPGPLNVRSKTAASKNRAVHFAGGRMAVPADGVGAEYSISLWIWNGMPTKRPANDSGETKPTQQSAGWFFSRDHDHTVTTRGDHLGIGCLADAPGRLVFQSGNGESAIGQTELKRWTWHRITLVRTNDSASVYIDDSETPELVLKSLKPAVDSDFLFFGGRSDNRFNFEGRLDEITLTRQ